MNGSTNYGLNGGVGYYVGSTEGERIYRLGRVAWLVRLHGAAECHLQPAPRLAEETQFVNGNCFAMPAPGTQGWWNLPDVHGPAYFKSDLSIYKDINFKEGQTVQFRGSGFNFLNHPLTSFNNSNLSTMYLTANDCSAADQAASTCPHYSSLSQALENTTITNTGTFGYTSFKNGVRIVELALKYTF